MRSIVFLSVAGLFAGFAYCAQMEETNTPGDTPPEPVAAEPLAVEPAAAEPTLETVLGELKHLREDMLSMQQKVEIQLNGVIEDLRAENERLRQEVRDLSKGAAMPPVPMPDKELLKGLYPADAAKKPSDTEEKPNPESSDTAEPAPPKAQVEFKNDVIAEWGRTPEEAAQKKSASLKGMTCVVPAGSADEDLIDLGRKLRTQFDAYDNVNIEVFDDLEAARSSTAPNAAPTGHRVLSISKHRASGRDVILLIHGETANEVPLAESGK
jgi:hypothetical protein